MLDIAEVTEASGVPASTLHVWERRGLIEPVGRSGLRRQYADDVLDTIAVIVLCQDSGFTLAEIAQLLAPDAFVDGKALLEAKLDQLRRHRAELDAAITGLEHSLACPHPHPLECPDFCGLLDGVLPRRSSNPD